MVLTLEDLTIEQEQMSFTERKRQGLLERNPKKAEYILGIEKMWEEFALEFNRESRKQRLEKLLIEFRFMIQKKAESLEKKWINKKISTDDFEYEFWITAWMLCEENYNHYTEFYLYETLLLALERKGIDIVRKYTKVKKRALNTASLPLLERAADLFPSDEDIEKKTTDRMLVQQMINEPSLSEQERDLLRYLYNRPEASLRHIADALGLGHPQKVKRLLDVVKRKLRNYENQFD